MCLTQQPGVSEAPPQKQEESESCTLKAFYSLIDLYNPFRIKTNSTLKPEVRRYAATPGY
jgi:hypothetical protein